MKKLVIIAAAAAILCGTAQSEAAGCIKGAIVGGLAAHVTHHSVLLGALGGCMVGKLLSHPPTSITYPDAVRMIGSDADFAAVAGSHEVDIVKLSALKGYVRNDGRTQAAIRGSSSVKALDGEIAGNADLAATLKSAGFAPSDVVAEAVVGNGKAILIVNG